MSMIRSIVAIVVVALACSVSLADEPTWTETFDDGVGRLSITQGQADEVFIHDFGDENINATFIRRGPDEGPDEGRDRRLAALGGLVTEDARVGFSVLWAPVSNPQGCNAWPLLGFFDSLSGSGSDVAVVRFACNGAYRLSINWDLPDPVVIDPEFVHWQYGEVYLVELHIDGPARSLSFSTSILTENGFVVQNSVLWSLPDTLAYSFDSLGMGNIVDTQGVGSTIIADIDDFSLLGLDCNGNEILDFLDIANEESNDNNSNGIPDECECPADITGNGVVDAADLAELLGAWGPCPEPPADCPADIHGSGDGIVRADDLAELLGSWGPCD